MTMSSHKNNINKRSQSKYQIKLYTKSFLFGSQLPDEANDAAGM